MKFIVMFLVLAIVGKLNFAQEREWEIVQEDQAHVNDGQEIEDEMEQMEYWRKRKISINKADAQDFYVFPFLSANQIEQLLLYRKHLGDFLDIKELQAVPGWDDQTIRKLLPFVSIQEDAFLRKKLSKSIKQADHQFLIRSSIKQQAGYLARYQFKSAHFQGGLQLEKDATEKLWQGEKGISFLSGQLSFSRMGIIRQLVVGDFSINMGQGLVLGLGRNVRKSGLPMLVKKQQPFLVPYRSTDENKFFRGIGVLISNGKWELGAFLSSNKLDGNLQSDTGLGNYVSSLQLSGIHATDAELQDKNSLELRSTGMKGSFSFGNFKIGAHGVAHEFSLPIIRSSDLYNKYSIQGRRNNAIGVKAESSFRNIHFFAELARDKEGQYATLVGMQIAMDRRLDLSIVTRKIAKEYRSLWASSFTEFTEPSDEKGVYMGLSFRPASVIQLDAYVDNYRSDWIKYQINSPVVGSDQLFMFQYKPDRKTLIYFRFKKEVKTDGMLSGQPFITLTGDKRSSGSRIHFEKQLSDFWTWRNRIEWGKQIFGEEVQSRGFIIYTEWFWKNWQKPISINGRVMFCETDNYDSRLYAYENDVLYYGLISAFYGKFLRLYSNINIDISPRMAIQMKVGQNFPVVPFSTSMRFQLLCRL